MAPGAGNPVLPPAPPAAFPSRSAPGAMEAERRTDKSPAAARPQAEPRCQRAGTRAAGPPQTQSEQRAGCRAAAERRLKAQRHPTGEAAPNAAPRGEARPEAPRVPAGPRPDPAGRTPTGGTPAGTAPRSAPQTNAAAPRSAQPGFGRVAGSILRRGPARPGPPPLSTAPSPPPAAALPWCTARRRPWRGARPRCGGRAGGGGGKMLRRRRGAPYCCYLAGCGAPLCALWERGGRAALPPTGGRAAECPESRARPCPALPAPGPGRAEGGGRPVPARCYRPVRVCNAPVIGRTLKSTGPRAARAAPS